MALFLWAPKNACILQKCHTHTAHWVSGYVGNTDSYLIIYFNCQKQRYRNSPHLTLVKNGAKL